MSKDDAINIMNNSDFIDKIGVLYLFVFFSFSVWKTDESVEETYYQRSRNVILNRAKDYYENYTKN